MLTSISLPFYNYSYSIFFFTVRWRSTTRLHANIFAQTAGSFVLCPAWHFPFGHPWHCLMLMKPTSIDASLTKFIQSSQIIHPLIDCCLINLLRRIHNSYTLTNANKQTNKTFSFCNFFKFSHTNEKMQQTIIIVWFSKYQMKKSNKICKKLK